MRVHKKEQMRFWSSAAWPKALSIVVATGLMLAPQGPIQAGAFIFAGDSYGLDLILHPSGYTGTGGTLEVGVCISTESAHQAALEVPVRNNIFVWNAMAPLSNNVQTGVVSGVDIESVLLHEMGHCIGLAHVNAASESGLSGDDTNYTKATEGANGVWDLNAGADGVVGSRDDLRGDDVNLHWFNRNNDPFELPVPTPMDSSAYTRDLAFLPSGHTFAENASREISGIRGYPYSEAVMQQMTYGGETQRDLTGDGVATMGIGASGLDEAAGTADDYTLELVYRGVQGTNASPAAGCDITISLEGTSFAYCSVGGSSISSGHWRITTGKIYLDPDYSWHFNTELRGNQVPDAVNDTASVDEDDSVNINVLANDTDPDGDTLSVSSVTDPPNGTASINPDDTIAYSPDPNFNGIDNFNYTAVDPTTGSDMATVTVTVNPVNDAPNAVDDSASTKDTDPVDVSVLANDTEVDGETLTIASVTQGEKGVVTNHSTYVTYQPNTGLSLPTTDTFTYTVEDESSSSDTATVTVTIDPKIPPVAGFTSVSVLKQVTFTDTSTDSDGTVVSRSWNFGDGNTSTAQHPVHTYATYDTFTVTLTVTDDDGATDDFSAPVTTAPDTTPPVITLSGDNPDSVGQNDTYTDPGFTATDDVDGDLTGSVNVTGWDKVTTIPGTYYLYYDVSDASGNPAVQRTRTVSVVANLAPTANFSSVVTGYDVDFTDASTDSDGTVTSWSWDFGDSGSSTARNPSHTYSTYGVYTVTLTATDDDGATDDFSADVTIDAPCSVSKSNIPSGQWVFMSLPCMPSNPTASTAFASGPQPGEYNTRWVLYTYDSSAQAYVRLGPDAVLQRGKGYLFFSLDAFASLSVEGEINTGDPIAVINEADSGIWNLVGNPFTGSVNWTDVTVSDGSKSYNFSKMDKKTARYACDPLPATGDCIMHHVMYKLESNIYVPYDGSVTDPGILSPLDAIWVRSHRAVTMTLTEAAAGAPAATMEAAVADASPKNNKGGKKNKDTLQEWYVRLVVESGDFRDAGNWFGMAKGAKDGLDHRDLVELTPHSSPYLTVLFTNPLFDEPVDWGYTRDIRRLNSTERGEWPFVVRASSGIGQATLRWEGAAGLLENAVLVDEGSGETIVLLPGNSYTFEMGGSEHAFRIIFN